MNGSREDLRKMAERVRRSADTGCSHQVQTAVLGIPERFLSATPDAVKNAGLRKVVLRYFRTWPETGALGWGLGLYGANGLGKALALDTLVPTPSGWSTMGALKKGDVVIHPSGGTTVVSFAHPVSTPQRCYRLVLDDGSEFEASGEHLWQTVDGRNRWNGTFALQTVSTDEIAATLRVTRGNTEAANHAIPLCFAYEGMRKEKPLVLDPYVLGVWLGDGTSREAAITCFDKDILSEVSRRGVVAIAWKTVGHYGLWSPSKRKRKGSNGFLDSLRMLGLLDNKHVPNAYMRAPEAQRMDLLSGLMDTDGTVSSQCGRVSFTSTLKVLADAVYELACSLGFKPSLDCKQKVCTNSETRAESTAWEVGWTTDDSRVFRLRRKANLQKRVRTVGSNSSRLYWRYIVGCERIEPKPMRCITVDAVDGMFVVGRSWVPTHNSWALASIVNHGALRMSVEAGTFKTAFFVRADDFFRRADPMAVVGSERGEAFIDADHEFLWRDRFASEPMLAISDLGKEDRRGKLSEKAPMLLGSVLRARVQNKLVTCIDTNLTFREHGENTILNVYGRSVYDLMQECIVPVKVTGVSLRQKAQGRIRKILGGEA